MAKKKCECCGYPANTDIYFYKGIGGIDFPHFLCVICKVSGIFEASEGFGPVSHASKIVLRSLGWIANHITSRIQDVEDEVERLREDLQDHF